MDTVLEAMRLSLWILGIWTVVSVIAAVPLSALLTVSARADEHRARAYRRAAWLTATQHVATR